MPARSGQQRSKWHCNRLLLVLLAGLLMQPLSSTALHGAASASNEKHPALESNDRLSIPSGSYHPFFKRTDGVLTIPVAAFDLDAAPVTKSQYLEFVRQHLGWRKSHVKALVAERNYLSDWSGDLDPGENLQAPVTYVSWFAARAYCSEHGRLPSVAEWERVAGATQTAPYSQDATDAAK